jgi:hypothetical protein
MGQLRQCGGALDQLTPEDCRNFFTAAGYDRV